ncbi:hypothetical protein A4D02_23960 [Niastella koreensis]|uniref:SH3 type 3 domain protein n=1 Tax=Niastella koreensis TaxID=354356 RepID=A0ABX3P135_9BACT|nr:hypothetical protein A4D02_23960 [Niastella koreensis]
MLLFLALGNFALAQDEPGFPDMRSWSINNQDTTDRYIFADTALVRVSPDTKQPPIDSLFAGDNIIVTGVTPNSLTIRGIKGPWLKINYTKNGVPKNGYIWQGLVSCAPLRRGNVKFVYGIERRADSIRKDDKYKIRRFLVRLKVVQDGRVLATQSFTTFDDESANYSSGKIMSGMGLTNVQNIVTIEFSGDACGISTYDYYFAFTKNNQLIPFPGKENVADAGAYYHSESFTFPNEKNGQPDTVVWNMENAEDTQKTDRKGDPIYKITEKKNTVYTWDGVNEKISSPVKK